MLLQSGWIGLADDECAAPRPSRAAVGQEAGRAGRAAANATNATTANTATTACHHCHHCQPSQGSWHQHGVLGQLWVLLDLAQGGGTGWWHWVVALGVPDGAAGPSPPFWGTELCSASSRGKEPGAPVGHEQTSPLGLGATPGTGRATRWAH